MINIVILWLMVIIMININGDYYDLVIFYSYVTVNVYQRVKKNHWKSKFHPMGSMEHHPTGLHRSPGGIWNINNISNNQPELYLPGKQTGCL